MLTNIEIDEELLSEAQRRSGSLTKQETVHRGLELLIRLGRESDVRALRGRLTREEDLGASRNY